MNELKAKSLNVIFQSSTKLNTTIQSRRCNTRSRVSVLRIGGTYGPASRILPSLLSVFKANYPQVEVILRSNSNVVIHNSILNGELEIAVTSGVPHSSLLYSEPYVPLKRVAFAAKDHPLVKYRAEGQVWS